MAGLLPPERDLGVLASPVRSSMALFGAFALVVLGLSLLERIGAHTNYVPFAVIGASFLLFALIALLGHARRAVDYYVADRRAPAPLAGLAAASGFAGLIAIGLAEGGYQTRAQFVTAATGLLLGFLIAGFLFAPGLRRFGAYSAGDFLAARFGGTWIRLAVAATAFGASFLVLLAHLKISSPLLATLLGLDPRTALYVVAALTAMAALPGGMRSLTWTQAIQYLLIALACLAPVGFLATQEGALAQDFGVLLIGNFPALSGRFFSGYVLPVAALAIGLASLPHVMARGLTVATNREAAMSMLWAVILSIALVAVGLLLAQLLVWAEGSAAPAGTTADIARLAAVLGAPPVVIAALVMAGLFGALFSVGQAALFSAATAISHDIWDEVVDPKGTEGRRILVARLIILAVTAAAAAIAAFWPFTAPTLVGWALALAAGGNFAPLLLGLWWRRCNEIGATAGIVAGFGFTAVIFLLAQVLSGGGPDLQGWANVNPATATFMGVGISAVVTIGISLLTPAAEIDPAAKTTGPRRGRLPMQERPA